MPPTPQPCPGRCNAAWRAAEIHRLATGEPHQITPMSGDPAWCERDTQRIRYALADMPYLAAKLLNEAENGTTATAERVSGSRERALHPANAAYRAIEEIHSLLTSWHDRLHYWGRVSERPADGVRQGPAIEHASRLLDAHLDWLLADCPDPDAPILLDEELSRLRSHVHRACRLDEPRPQPRDGVPCWNCDLMALVYELDVDGSTTGYTMCRACGESKHESDMQRWIALLAAATTAVSSATRAAA